MTPVGRSRLCWRRSMVPELSAGMKAFPSFAELRKVQSELGRLRTGAAPDSPFWKEVEAFVRIGAATGAVLCDENERWSAQGLLDYWATTLERQHKVHVEATLADFDIAMAPELPDDACPYVGLDAFLEKDSRYF